ncbi:MAG: ATP-binding protein [Lysobacteraceae bacterium]
MNQHNPPNVPSGWFKRLLHPSAITDVVDRGNAPTVQVVLFLLGVLPPLAWAYRLLAPSRPVTDSELLAMGLSLTVSALALVCLYLVRRGHLRLATRIFLGIALTMMVLSYAVSGNAAQAHSMPINIIWIIMAGLILGRRELWLAYAAFLLALTLGAWAEIRVGADHWSHIAGDAAVGASIFLFITLVIDRAMGSLREALAGERRNQAELSAANRKLREEMRMRQEAQQQLVHGQKMEAVGRLASGMAHDFNNVLNVILGYAGRRHALTETEEAGEILQGIERAAQRGVGVAQRLLKLARPDAPQPKVFDAAQAARDVAPMLRQLLPDSIRIQVDAPEQALPIRLDRSQFDLILLNLATNSRDAMPAGGHILLSVSDHDAEVELALTDDGTGMDAVTLERLFEPFYTTKPSSEGYGLGLSVVQGLVHEANGRIHASSAPGEGASFRIQLPRAA